MVIALLAGCSKKSTTENSAADENGAQQEEAKVVSNDNISSAISDLTRDEKKVVEQFLVYKKPFLMIKDIPATPMVDFKDRVQLDDNAKPVDEDPYSALGAIEEEKLPESQKEQQDLFNLHLDQFNKKIDYRDVNVAKYYVYNVLNKKIDNFISSYLRSQDYNVVIMVLHNGFQSQHSHDKYTALDTSYYAFLIKGYMYKAASRNMKIITYRSNDVAEGSIFFSVAKYDEKDPYYAQLGQNIYTAQPVDFSNWLKKSTELEEKQKLLEEEKAKESMMNNDSKGNSSDRSANNKKSNSNKTNQINTEGNSDNSSGGAVSQFGL